VTTEGIENYLRDAIVSALADVLSESGFSLLELPSRLEEVSTTTRGKVADRFSKLGLQLVDFLITSITPPEQVQQAIDARTAMGAIGDLRSFMLYEAARGMGNAGAATGDSAMQVGVGAGLGMMLPGMLREAMRSQGEPSSARPQPGQPADVARALPSTTDFGDLRPSGPSVGNADAQAIIRSLAEQHGWRLKDDAAEWQITVPIGNLRQQRVSIEFQAASDNPAPVVSIQSRCGIYRPELAEKLLRHNQRLIQGAFSIRESDSGPEVLLGARALADTADSLELCRLISAIAWQADRVESQLSEMDER
jgi:hypothetical protein